MISNPTPRYYLIYRLLQQAIQNFEYGHDGALPSEHNLAEQFNVSRLTIRRSLDLLQQEGLIEKQQGIGTFVTPRNVQIEPIRADINTLIKSVAQMGAHTQVQLLKFTYEKPNLNIKKILQLGHGELIQKSTRVRFYEGKPFSHLTTYVPEVIGRLYEKEDLAHTPLHDLFAKNQIAVHAADQSLSAILADPEKAEVLQVEVGSPLLCIRRLVYDKEEQPVEYLEAAYNPSYYEYRMKLEITSDKTGDSWLIKNT